MPLRKPSGTDLIAFSVVKFVYASVSLVEFTCPFPNFSKRNPVFSCEVCDFVSWIPVSVLDCQRY